MSRAVDSHGGVRRLRMFLAYLSNRRSASGTVVIVVKGGGQLALEDASSDGIRYLEGGVHCLIKGGRECSIFNTGVEFH